MSCVRGVREEWGESESFWLMSLKLQRQPGNRVNRSMAISDILLCCLLRFSTQKFDYSSLNNFKVVCVTPYDRGHPNSTSNFANKNNSGHTNTHKFWINTTFNLSSQPNGKKTTRATYGNLIRNLCPGPSGNLA